MRNNKKYPICRALNCKYNHRDTCHRDKASEICGYKCPYFEAVTIEKNKEFFNKAKR